MNTYALERDPEGAELVLGWMRGKGLRPEVAVYTTLMHAYAGEHPRSLKKAKSTLFWS
jgi:hypothetical protein